MTNQMTEQQEQARRMEGIQRLAGGVAHDFNNILTIILGYSEMIGSDVTASDKVRHDARAVVEATARATALTRQLLQFGRRQDVKRQTVSVRDFLIALEPLLRQSIPDNIAINVTEVDDALLTLMDPGQLEQVLVNLATNARDAMPRGGVLSISARQIDMAAGENPPPGSYILVDVTDTGVGMNEHTRERAFEPFFTTKAKGAGTGFGLATVYAIVTHSDGYVRVTSTPGSGSTFSVYLPRHTI
jgi:two-component system cell cycle sensor histidine kinase/response regulator CckA